MISYYFRFKSLMITNINVLFHHNLSLNRFRHAAASETFKLNAL